MSAYDGAVLEHFRHPRNRGRLAAADIAIEAANPLCGDRLRLELVFEQGRIVRAAFTADACVLCVASASMLTEHVRGMAAATAREVAEQTALDWIGAVPAARVACVTLPIQTLHRALHALPAE